MNWFPDMPAPGTDPSRERDGDNLWFTGAPRLFTAGVVGIDTHEAVAATSPAEEGFEVSETGHVDHARVQLRIFAGIEHGAMHSVHGIIVHQTGGASAQSTFNSYGSSPYGAHFLIDKDGTIYQTASLTQRCWHVGNLKARCVAESRCTPTELKALEGKAAGKGIGRVEAEKEWPDRYPGNSDSIGIELVGATAKGSDGKEDIYEQLSDAQQTSLGWLIGKLRATYEVSLSEIFRHPEVSWKNPTEAESATW